VPLKVKVKQAPIDRYLAKLARRFDRTPVDSRLLLRNGNPFVTKDVTGRRLQQPPLARAIVLSLKTHDRDPLQVSFEKVEPDLTRRSIGDVIVIRRGVNKLELYDGMKLRRTFGVATGTAQYPTPLGRFHIVVKWRNPWWYPPASDWAKDAKPIPPGPGNPLGTRWMGLSAPLVGIHGTPDAASIGYSASHGCIRMLIPEVEWLFEQVGIGAPVFVVR
jgi:lipoprotein-anchoring transpeptidase ErfK/SrfK